MYALILSPCDENGKDASKNFRVAIFPAIAVYGPS
jgi:hypothetical protein